MLTGNLRRKKPNTQWYTNTASKNFRNGIIYSVALKGGDRARERKVSINWKRKNLVKQLLIIQSERLENEFWPKWKLKRHYDLFRFSKSHTLISSATALIGRSAHWSLIHSFIRSFVHSTSQFCELYVYVYFSHLLFWELVITSFFFLHRVSWHVYGSKWISS